MNNRIARFAIPMLALAALLPISAGAGALLADGTITGKVTNEDGTPAAKVEVRVMKPMARRGGGAGGEAPKAEPKFVQPAEPPAGGAGGGGGKRPPPVATATTDDKGEFTVSVPAGEYTVQVGKRGEAMGRSNVTVEEGKTANVDIKLKKMAPKAN